MFAAGRPTSRYADDVTQRCSITPNCTDSIPSMKLQDAYHSRPVLVGPPTGISTDPTYVSTFFETVLTGTTYGGSEDVLEYTHPSAADQGVYVLTSNGTIGTTQIAGPC